MTSINTTKMFSDGVIDVVPVAFARPIITPPRSFNDPADPPLFAYRCPYSGGIKLIDEALTIWPHATDCNGMPVVLRLGQAIFIGKHLLSPEKVERLKAVLGKAYEDDHTLGYASRWHDSGAVTSAWQPAKIVREMPKLFVQHRPKPPAKRKAFDPVPAA